MILKRFLCRNIGLLRILQEGQVNVRKNDGNATSGRQLNKMHVNQCWPKLHFQSKLKFNFSALSIKNMKVNYDPSKKTQIISLNQQQLEQLSQLSSYLTSISFLQKNELTKSLEYLDFSLNDAKNMFPESINLHMCLLNRKSILLKLLSEQQEFVSALEQIYFLGQSLKGIRNMETQKHLKNYLLSLLFDNIQKMSLVIQFVQGSEQIVNSPKLQRSISQFVFFDSIADILVRNQPERGFTKLDSLSEQTFNQKYFKTNNLAWMKFISWKKSAKSESALTKKVKDEGQELVKKFLRTLFDMEYCVPQNIGNKPELQPSQNAHLVQLIKGYLVGNFKQLRFIPQKVKLAHPQSHIVSMNIANLLYESQRYEQCVYFLKLSLKTGLDQGQVQRVGGSLLLIAKLNFKSGQNYEQIILSILQNAKVYPLHIIKESLSLYSQFLFKEARYIEAECYANQIMFLQGNLDLEGLLVPDFDFSF